MIITIDGTSGSGKSSIVRLLSERNQFQSINSGAFYRAATLLLYRRLGNTETISNIEAHAEDMNYISRKYVPNMYWKNDMLVIANAGTDAEANAETDARTDAETDAGTDAPKEGDATKQMPATISFAELMHESIERSVSQVSCYEPLRMAITAQVRRNMVHTDCVIEGRDAGTEIYPEADLKFYLDADAEERTKRRVLQHQETLGGDQQANSFEIVRERLEKRDFQDKNKGKYSLKQTNGVIYINSTHQTIEQIYHTVYTKLEQAMEKEIHTKNVIDVGIPQDFDKMIDSSYHQLLNTQNIQPGEIINGTIVKITENEVFLDLGFKTEGRIPNSEFENTNVTPQLGVVVQVVVVKNNPDMLVVSYSQAIKMNSVKELKDQHQNNGHVKATVKEYVTGGFSVEIMNSVPGFVPVSQMDIKHISEKNAKQYLGKEFDFCILELFRNKKLHPVLSRRKYLIEKTQQDKDNFLETHAVGDRVTGRVKTFTSFGAFIDLGGFDALLHISDISWRYNIRPTEILKKNVDYEFKIIRLDPETKKIGLSLKELEENPWNNIETLYPVDSIVSGKVIKILNYGAIVSIDDVVEGFIHISEMSWIKYLNHPMEIMKLGSIVKCKVLRIDKEKERLSLGLKQTENNPWDSVSSLYPIGLKVALPVKRIVKNGIFLEFDEGYRGFISQEDLSWNKKRMINFSVGDMVECVVLSYDMANYQINLGIKQMEENPWESNLLRPGSIVEGVITAVTDFGIFVRFPIGVEGLVPKNKTFNPRTHTSYEQVRSNFKKGDAIQVMILAVQKDNQKLLLSLQDLKDTADQKEMSKHIVQDVQSERATSLGSIINNTET